MTHSARDVKATLATAQFLHKLSAEDLEKVAAIASTKSLEAGAVLYQEGEACRMLHVVSSGLVALDMCMPRQGCTRILTVGPGELLGWSALLSDGTMTVRATAVEETTLIALPAHKLRQLCDDDHDIGYAIMQQVAVSLSRRLLATRLQTLDMFGETQPVAAPVSPDNS
ncbi:MAG: Crp/Fnr family transcriptional regulator [Planctomycetota bacterium]|nr:MAG: Crp/Fnr family transcriptional regulator [Planctomycetota bacterium]REJ96748.1 MAG: Crp/Fnr family transcriptional regulator [Planctomycetota bacterium]REK25158.1 MAG: Crp/Fnr family transcriptional regulator [Planctomycetota bacterium]REK38799.1 MAG: Crp/Fnr family transcriptional regulator [Planctomycetota bacterium]